MIIPLQLLTYLFLMQQSTMACHFHHYEAFNQRRAVVVVNESNPVISVQLNSDLKLKTLKQIVHAF